MEAECSREQVSHTHVMAVGCRPTTKGYRFFGGDVHLEVDGELARKVVTSPVVDAAPRVENRR